MATTISTQSEPSRPPQYFATTHWSVVLAATRNDTTRAHAALEQLCQAYWYPLYAYVRRRGHSPHDAEDLTQAFFARLLERESLANVDPQRGRFRSFLLGAINNFLVNEWEKLQAQKRGSGQRPVSLDVAVAEERFDAQTMDTMTPDKAFDKEWATALLDKVLCQLEAEFRDKPQMFSELKRTLAGSRESQPYADLAQQLGMSEGAVKTAVHRFRKRYRELLQAEIAATVASPEDVDAEMKELFKAIAGR